jgi:hypothetical protein
MTFKAEDLEYIREAWGSAYIVNAPFTRDRCWQATALFGDHDVLTASSAEALIGKIRRHYPGLVATGQQGREHSE